MAPKEPSTCHSPLSVGSKEVMNLVFGRCFCLRQCSTISKAVIAKVMSIIKSRGAFTSLTGEGRLYLERTSMVVEVQAEITQRLKTE